MSACAHWCWRGHPRVHVPPGPSPTEGGPLLALQLLGKLLGGLQPPPSWLRGRGSRGLRLGTTWQLAAAPAGTLC